MYLNVEKEKKWFSSLTAFRVQLCLKHEHQSFITGLTFERNKREIF